MEYPYTVNDITTKFNISKTTFYHQVKKNTDFFSANSTKIKGEGEKTKPFTKYNQAVFDFFASQYGTEEADTFLENASARGTLLETKTAGGTSSPSFKSASAGGRRTEAPETPAEAPEAPEKGEERETPYQEKINALESQIEALKRQLEKAEGERAELIKQNGNLLLLLNQEKAEKQLLLPAPKKSIGERIKSIFRK